MLPSRTAMASRVENRLSTVKILPFTRMVSAFWDHAGEAAANATMASNAVRRNFAMWIFISLALKIVLVEAFRCAVFLVPVHGLAARVHRYGAYLGELIERL